MVILRGLSLTAVLLVCVVAGPDLASAQTADRPSIVVVVTDDQRWDTLWAMPIVQRELAAHGVTFTNAFATNPLCCPSRATILTGQYSHDTGVYTNTLPFGGFLAFDDSSTIATWLERRGYRTALVGKYLNRYNRTTYIPPGWSHWFAFSGTRYFDYSLNDNGQIVKYGADESDYSTDVLAADAVSFIEDTTGPLFLYFAPFAPHSTAGLQTTPAPRHADEFRGLPPSRPPSYNEADVSDKPRWIRRRHPTPEKLAKADSFRREQLQSLQAVDEAVGRLVAALRRTGRLDNTVVVFMSDNGLLWGEHRWFSKVVPYEESIRVPLVIRHDPLTDSARQDRHLVLNVDLARTLARLAGARAPGAKGRSLVPLLAGENVAWRTDFLLEGMLRPVSRYCGVRSTRWTYAQYRNGFEELYDLVVDRYQLENVAKASMLRERLVTFRKRTIQLCKPPPPGLTLRSPCLVAGNAKPNVLTGTRFYDLICGRGGGDRIIAGAGDDDVLAGAGQDFVAGGEGADALAGSTGADRLFGDNGRDRITARDDRADLVACGNGTDVAIVDKHDRVRGCESVRRKR